MSRRAVMVKFFVPNDLSDEEFGELLILQLDDAPKTKKFRLSSGRWVHSLSAEERYAK